MVEPPSTRPILSPCGKSRGGEHAFFYPKTSTDTGKVRSGSVCDWFDTFQILISYGHTRGEILTYPLSALEGFIEAVGRAEKRQYLWLATATRVAHHADADTYKSWSRELSG